MHANKNSDPRRGLFAAVDLGSNSFRLLIGKVDQTSLGNQIKPIDTLKISVRLAAGLEPDGSLNRDAHDRGMAALAKFGERLRSFEPGTVRAVATNTLRVAKNANAFLKPGQAALGFPIEVISGREEARLIYIGAAHALPTDNTHRLVVDIGGGSSELIVGRNDLPSLMESAPIGCVSLSQRFFANGDVSADAMAHARLAARDALTSYSMAYHTHGWEYAVGTSGTAKSLSQIADQTLGETRLTKPALEEIAKILAKEGSANTNKVRGLRADRRAVLPGGLALMLAVFDEFGVKTMRYCNGALREGALYDFLGRGAGHDMRSITVSQMGDRYDIDTEHGHRLAQTALALYEQVADSAEQDHAENQQLLTWAAQLAELGLSISHDSFHKHTAYVLTNADMQGFSWPEQRVLSTLTLGQTGGLRKLRDVVRGENEWLMVLCLRVASIMHRRRDDETRPLPSLSRKKRGIRLSLPANWVAQHPLTDDTLRSEAALWGDVSAFDQVDYRAD